LDGLTMEKTCYIVGYGRRLIEIEANLESYEMRMLVRCSC
jgi:hypothetical protein